jgi:hypothetical protein
MNMAEIWEEHKVFLMGLGAAVVVFFVTSGILGSAYFDAADDVEAKGDRLITTLASIPDPARGALREIETIKKELAKTVEENARRVELRPGESFSLPPSGRDADLRFNALVQKLREELVDASAPLDVTVDPGLGLPESTPTSRQEIEGYTVGLQVVERVCRIAVEEGALSIAPIRILPRSVSRFGRGERFVEKIEVEARVTGFAESIVALLGRLQHGEDYVPLGASSLNRARDGSGLVTADLLLYGTRIHPDRPAVAADPRRRRR